MFGKTKFSILYFSFILIISCFFPSHGFGANYPLQITNIKPAGTGSPAIPSSNRIFRAYPGIEYNIRPAIFGGTYPFTFSLSNAPSGMTINESTGMISWPNPQSNSGAITLSVTDAENTTVTTTWAITVSTTGFRFVNSNYSGSIETGSITQPFKSIANMLNGTSSQTDIVYFRSGSYQFVEYNSIIGVRNMYLSGKPHSWLGYPGETVTMDGQGTGYINNSAANGYCLRSASAVYIDNINFKNFTNFALVLGADSYQTVRRCTFSYLGSNSSVNNNYGFIYTTGGSGTTFGYYNAFQDNDFGFYVGASALGSVYSMNYLVIENNNIHNNGGVGLSGYNTGIALKEWLNYVSIRGNKIVSNKYNAFGNANLNSTFVDSTNIDVSFNYFANILAGTNGFAHSFNGYGFSGFHTNYFYFYRNTVLGGIAMSNLNATDCTNGGATGPWSFYSNIIVAANTSFSSVNAIDYFYYDSGNASNSPQTCITDTNNLKGLPSANLIDASGNLTPSYSSYLGTRGWQVAPNTSTGLKAPTGLKLL